jgi:hypothetical protein
MYFRVAPHRLREGQTSLTVRYGACGMYTRHRARQLSAARPRAHLRHTLRGINHVPPERDMRAARMQARAFRAESERAERRARGRRCAARRPGLHLVAPLADHDPGGGPDRAVAIALTGPSIRRDPRAAL